MHDHFAGKKRTVDLLNYPSVYPDVIPAAGVPNPVVVLVPVSLPLAAMA